MKKMNKLLATASVFGVLSLASNALGAAATANYRLTANAILNLNIPDANVENEGAPGVWAAMDGHTLCTANPDIDLAARTLSLVDANNLWYNFTGAGTAKITAGLQTASINIRGLVDGVTIDGNNIAALNTITAVLSEAGATSVYVKNSSEDDLSFSLGGANNSYQKLSFHGAVNCNSLNISANAAGAIVVDGDDFSINFTGKVNSLTLQNAKTISARSVYFNMAAGVTNQVGLDQVTTITATDATITFADAGVAIDYAFDNLTELNAAADAIYIGNNISLVTKQGVAVTGSALTLGNGARLSISGATIGAGGTTLNNNSVLTIKSNIIDAALNKTFALGGINVSALPLAPAPADVVGAIVFDTETNELVFSNAAGSDVNAASLPWVDYVTILTSNRVAFTGEGAVTMPGLKTIESKATDVSFTGAGAVTMAALESIKAYTFVEFYKTVDIVLAALKTIESTSSYVKFGGTGKIEMAALETITADTNVEFSGAGVVNMTFAGGKSIRATKGYVKFTGAGAVTIAGLENIRAETNVEFSGVGDVTMAALETIKSNNGSVLFSSEGKVTMAELKTIEALNDVKFTGKGEVTMAKFDTITAANVDFSGEGKVTMAALVNIDTTTAANKGYVKFTGKGEVTMAKLETIKAETDVEFSGTGAVTMAALKTIESVTEKIRFSGGSVGSVKDYKFDALEEIKSAKTIEVSDYTTLTGRAVVGGGLQVTSPDGLILGKSAKANITTGRTGAVTLGENSELTISGGNAALDLGAVNAVATGNGKLIFGEDFVFQNNITAAEVNVTAAHTLSLNNPNSSVQINAKMTNDTEGHLTVEVKNFFNVTQDIGTAQKYIGELKFNNIGLGKAVIDDIVAGWAAAAGDPANAAAALNVVVGADIGTLRTGLEAAFDGIVGAGHQVAGTLKADVSAAAQAIYDLVKSSGGAEAYALDAAKAAAALLAGDPKYAAALKSPAFAAPNVYSNKLTATLGSHAQEVYSINSNINFKQDSTLTVAYNYYALKFNGNITGWDQAGAVGAQIKTITFDGNGDYTRIFFAGNVKMNITNRNVGRSFTFTDGATYEGDIHDTSGFATVTYSGGGTWKGNLTGRSFYINNINPTKTLSMQGTLTDVAVSYAAAEALNLAKTKATETLTSLDATNAAGSHVYDNLFLAQAAEVSAQECINAAYTAYDLDPTNPLVIAALASYDAAQALTAAVNANAADVGNQALAGAATTAATAAETALATALNNLKLPQIKLTGDLTLTNSTYIAGKGAVIDLSDATDALSTKLIIGNGSTFRVPANTTLTIKVKAGEANSAVLFSPETVALAGDEGKFQIGANSEITIQEVG
ncbi:MAG: hypothetical protein KA998_00880, partial [Rickettsiaceae bacterium]|nr:hypothetical protein [Rickettsiaceae bacterium]